MNMAEPPNLPAGSSIKLCPDGSYRWVYEFNLWTNPTILFTVLKIFIGIVVGIGAFMVILLVPDLVRGYADANDIAETLRFAGMLALIFVGLAIVGYAVYAIMMGGRYCVVFEMDESGIEHRQLPKQVEKAQVIDALNVLAGLATGKPGQVGVGILSASRDASTSTFESMKSIKGSRLLRVIKVNEPLTKNQVYVEPEDYDFVFSYIRDRCPNAEKVKG